MATRHYNGRIARPKFSLDLPMAALAALSVAFVAYAMPGSLLSRAINTSGLPTLLPAAAGPLGAATRIAIVAVAAAATFLFVWFLLRALGSGPPESRRPQDVPSDAPRVRRADSHPDAPSRRPLFARDLGEPLELTPDQGWSAFSDRAEEEPADIDTVEAEPIQEPEQPSIPHLMQRLELGLIRRRRPDLAAVPAAEPDAPAPFDDPVDARLRSALDDLQKLASRGT